MSKNEVRMDDSATPETSAANESSTRKRPKVDNQSPLEKARRYSESDAYSSMLPLKDGTKDKASARKEVDYIDVLPPEIFQAILRNVTTNDLLKCRQVNSKWSEISSHLLRKRADVQLRFDFKEGRFLRHIEFRSTNNVCANIYRYHIKSLSDLVYCLKDSQNFPFTNFRFDGSMTNFGNEDMKSFLSIWADNVVALAVTLDNLSNVRILRDLLLVNIVNLKKLELRCCILKEIPSTVQLSVDLKGLQLPKLEILCVNSEYRKFRSVVEHILAAASNLKQFELHPLTFYWVTPDDLAMLQTFNKLHCLKNVQIDLCKVLIAYWQKSPNYSKLKLRKLVLRVNKLVLRDPQLKNSGTHIINQLLRSSMNVMEILSIEPLGELVELAIPKLEKLQKFELLCRDPPYSEKWPIFSPPFELADNFPNLKELVMHGLDNVSFSSKLLLSVETLKFIGDISADMMKATPNVRILLIEEELDDIPDKFRIDFQAIAKYLPKLESIGLPISASSYRELLHSLDAQLTGFSESACKTMSAELRNKYRLTPDELANYQLQRKNLSIVDLKELKQLDVAISFKYCCETHNLSDQSYSESVNLDNHSGCVEAMRREKDAGGFDFGSNLYQTGFSKVSKFLAFDLMPQLTVRIHKTLLRSKFSVFFF